MSPLPASIPTVVAAGLPGSAASARTHPPEPRSAVVGGSSSHRRRPHTSAAPPVGHHPLSAEHQAQGLLMAYYDVDADQAAALLHQWASTRRVMLRELCLALVSVGATQCREPFGAVCLLLGSGDPDSDPC